MSSTLPWDTYRALGPEGALVAIGVAALAIVVLTVAWSISIELAEWVRYVMRRRLPRTEVRSKREAGTAQPGVQRGRGFRFWSRGDNAGTGATSGGDSTNGGWRERDNGEPPVAFARTVLLAIRRAAQELARLAASNRGKMN